MNESLEHELEAEIAGELEGGVFGESSHEAHESHEHEAEAGAHGEGELEGLGEVGESGHGEQILESLLGESESESESHLGEAEANHLGEGEASQLGESEAALLGESEAEGEGYGELLENEGESELENGEQFFRRAFRSISRLARSAAPILKGVARVAAPIVGKAVGGLVGGPAGAVLGSHLARLAAQQLREQELAGEHELPFGEQEVGELQLGEHEVSLALGEHESHAERLAHFAAAAEAGFESEAMAGAAASITISARDRQALRAIVPNLVRGAAILTRILRMRRSTRPFVRVVPTIVRRTVAALRRGAGSGQPITRQRAASVMARQTRRVLASPRFCAAVVARNVQAVRGLRRPARLGPISSGPAAGRFRRRRMN